MRKWAVWAQDKICHVTSQTLKKPQVRQQHLRLDFPASRPQPIHSHTHYRLLPLRHILTAAETSQATCRKRKRMTKAIACQSRGEKWEHVVGLLTGSPCPTIAVENELQEAKEALVHM